MALEERSVCVPGLALHGHLPAHTRQYVETVARRVRVLTMASRISAVVSAFFGVFSIFAVQGGVWIGILIMVCAGVYLAIPLLCRFGELIAPLTFIVVAYVLLTVLTSRAGTGSGLQFYYLVGASIMVLVLGIEHIVL